MRAAPPIEFTVSRFGVWRAALGVLAALGAAAMALWWASAEPPAPTVALVALAGATAAALPWWRSMRQRPVALRWDGVQWHLAAAGREAVPGRLAVAIDLGAWCLLRFVADGSGAAWVPLQRRGLDGDWHAIRIALNAPR